MSLTPPISYRDLLWIAIPGTLIVTLLDSALGMQLQSGDIGVVILVGVIVGYVLDNPLGDISNRVYARFSRRFQSLQKRWAYESSRWDLEELETLLTTDEKQNFFELDGYKHLHRNLSLIFSTYAGYNFLLVFVSGIYSTSMVFSFRLPSLILAVSSGLVAYSSSKTFLRYEMGIIDQYVLYAKANGVEKIIDTLAAGPQPQPPPAQTGPGQTGPNPPSPVPEEGRPSSG